MAVSLLETKMGHIVKEDGFSKKDLQDVYLQAFFKEGYKGITRKTLSTYLNRLVTEINSQGC